MTIIHAVRRWTQTQYYLKFEWQQRSTLQMNFWCWQRKRKKRSSPRSKNPLIKLKAVIYLPRLCSGRKESRFLLMLKVKMCLVCSIVVRIRLILRQKWHDILYTRCKEGIYSTTHVLLMLSRAGSCVFACNWRMWGRQTAQVTSYGTGGWRHTVDVGHEMVERVNGEAIRISVSLLWDKSVPFTLFFFCTKRKILIACETGTS